MAAKREFTIDNALSYGWDAMKANFVLFLGILVIMGFVQAVPYIFERIEMMFFVLFVVSLAISLILYLGFYQVLLDLFDRKKTSFETLFSRAQMFPDYLVASVLYGLIVFAGLILLIVPGIIWAIKYQFYGYYIVDKKMGPREALRASGNVTKGYKWSLFGLTLACLGINILGALALFVGLFVSIPVTVMACTYAYRTLDGNNPQKAGKSLAKRK
jgi:uncharacterized membrane protein